MHHSGDFLPRECGRVSSGLFENRIGNKQTYAAKTALLTACGKAIARKNALG
jgi:hypothetical protein